MFYLIFTLTAVDPCDGDPCGDNGQCVQEGGLDFTCQCVHGFIGYRCEYGENTEKQSR